MLRILVTTFNDERVEGYLAVTFLIIELEQKLQVFWDGGEQSFAKQASKLIKKIKCVHVVRCRST